MSNSEGFPPKSTVLETCGEWREVEEENGKNWKKKINFGFCSFFSEIDTLSIMSTEHFISLKIMENK